MIREARLKEIPRLVELLKKYWEEADCKKLTFDVIACHSTFYSGIIDDEKDLSVLEIEDEIVGFTHSHIATTGFSSDKILECDLLYVLPEYRVGSNGLGLIRNLSKLGRLHKVKYVYLGVASGIHTEKTSRLYQKLGYKEIGKDFRLEV
jgi:N-acetylglutamate synthase-like GNAT family acetyltransferase